jgi:uncharacterized membrane protein
MISRMPRLCQGAYIFAAIYLPLVVAFSWDPTPFSQGLAAAGIAAAFAHASFAYGARHALALFVICTSVAFAMENLGIATGFPFGHYHFEVGRDLPRIGAVPLVVGPLWFGMGYFSWAVAGVLLENADFRLKQNANTFVLPVAAAFVMSQWDLVMDAPSATVSKAWVWHDGGGFYGVPWSNFLGWMLTSWLFYQAFALYLRRQTDALAGTPGESRCFKAVAVLFYLSAGLTHLTPLFMGQTGEAADGAGRIWPIRDVREATAVVMIFTMGFTSFIALHKLARRR